MKNREDIYNEVIQEYSEILESDLGGDDIQEIIMNLVELVENYGDWVYKEINLNDYDIHQLMDYEYLEIQVKTLIEGTGDDGSKEKKVFEINYIIGFINTEIYNHKTIPDYWGGIMDVENSTIIYNYVEENGICSQDWFDRRLKYTTIELYEDILNEVKLEKNKEL